MALRGEGTKGLLGTNALGGAAGGDLVRLGTRFGDVTAEKLVRYIWGTRVTTWEREKKKCKNHAFYLEGTLFQVIPHGDPNKKRH